jgi:APA family basic amino acid/polyamine antiporter
VAVAISWANYLKTFLAESGIHIPDWISTDYLTASKIPGLLDHAPHLFGLPLVFNLPALGIVAAITGILMLGIKESARFNAVMVCVKLAVLGLFIVIGIKTSSTSNWTPFMPNGFSGMFAGAAVIFFAFIGFDAVSTVAEEAKNPQRDLPIGIMASLIACTIIYVGVAAVFTGMVPYQALKNLLSSQQAEPLAIALQYVNIKGLAISVVALGSVIAHTAVLLVFQMGQPRIFFSMARDGLLPPFFAKVHPKYRTPWTSTLLTGVGVGAMSLVSSLDEMVDLTNIGTLFAFILVCAGVIILRVKDPNRPRAFRSPFGVLFPVLGIIGCFGLIYYLPPTSWLRFAAWLNLGLLVYVTYGIRESRLTGRDTADNPREHDARSSFSGAWLGLAGSAVTILACLADAMRRDTLSAGWWFPQSAWLWIPLLLNVVLLCPIVFNRARRAGELPGSGPAKAIAALHFLVVGGYLVAGLLVK